MQTPNERTLLCLGAVAALLAVGALVGSYPAYLLGLAMVNVIAAVGLNLLVGNSGQISLCHSSFMAVGAYSSSLLASGLGLPFWAAIPAGAAVAALVGALLGLPARRLSGIYLALATLGFLQIVQIVVEEFSDLTGGVRGLNTAKPMFFGSPLTSYGVYCVVAVVCVLAVWLAINIKRSRIGREFDAVRLSPHAAQALGISVARVKLTAFALSAAYAGLAGGLFAILVGFIDPNEFGIAASLRQLTYIVVGGLGSIGGSIVGAALLSGLPELLRPIKEYTDFAAALILLAALLFMPHGLASAWQRLMPKPKPKAARRGVPA
jgi:branched-chain amino acid transport system permease protein